MKFQKLFFIVVCVFFIPMRLFSAEKKQTPDESLKWTLITVDVVSAAWAGYTIYDYNKSVDVYDRHYDEINDTTVENYDKLTAERNRVKGREALMALSCGAAGIFLTCTLVDMLFVHYIFPEGVKAYYEPETRTYMLSYNEGF